MKKKRRRPARAPRHPHLTANQQAFALAWLSNGYNAALAYRTAYPEASVASAQTGGPRLLRNGQVRAYITDRVEAQLGQLAMAADKALGRLGLMASATLDMAFDAHGKLLEPAAWPIPLREAAKGYDVRRRKLVLTDKLQALRTILELAGKLKHPLSDSVDALADAILADQERRKREREEREREDTKRKR